MQDALDDVANGPIWGRQVAENIIATRFGPVEAQGPAPMPPDTGTGTANDGGSIVGGAGLGLLAAVLLLPATFYIVRRRKSVLR